MRGVRGFVSAARLWWSLLGAEDYDGTRVGPRRAWEIARCWWQS